MRVMYATLLTVARTNHEISSMCTNQKNCFLDEACQAGHAMFSYLFFHFLNGIKWQKIENVAAIQSHGNSTSEN